MSDKFPLPNDRIEDGIVVASVYYNEDENLATILVLRPNSPYFRVGVWNYVDKCWDGSDGYAGGHYYDHMNIVPAIRSKHLDSLGYEQLGGDY